MQLIEDNFSEDCCENRWEGDRTIIALLFQGGDRIKGLFSFPSYPDSSVVSCSTLELAVAPYNYRKASGGCFKP